VSAHLGGAQLILELEGDGDHWVLTPSRESGVGNKASNPHLGAPHLVLKV